MAKGSLEPSDYTNIEPDFKNENRPLAPQSEAEPTNSARLTFNRTSHTTTAIGDKLYVWGGTGSTSHQPAADVSAQSSAHFVVFNTLTNTYDILTPDTSKCRDGLPKPRTHHTATSSAHPGAGALPNGPTIDAYGTIFIHGGRSFSAHRESDITDFRDTWKFDVGTRVWTRLPEIPQPGPSEVVNEGRISYVNGRLWRLGDGFGRAMYLELAEHDSSPAPNKSLSGGPNTNDASVLGIGLKGDGKWQVICFGTEATDPNGPAGTSTASTKLISTPHA